MTRGGQVLTVTVYELWVFCPGCKAWETLLFSRRGRLLPTLRFNQDKEGRVRHDCGTGQPCRLYK